MHGGGGSETPALGTQCPVLGQALKHETKALEELSNKAERILEKQLATQGGYLCPLPHCS